MFEIAADGAAEPPEVPGAEGFGDVSGVVLAHLLAPVLANLDEVPDGVEGDGLLVDATVALSRLEDWAVAARMRVLAKLQQRLYAEMSSYGMVAHRDSRGTKA
ncbi:MAG: hypothetical protein ACJ71T_16300 [Actinomycetales bacterium]